VSVQEIPYRFRAIHEELPGAKWRALHADFWPSYRRWFLSQGNAARPSYVKSRLMLGRHMPELLGTYDRLVELAGGGDVAARLLALYDPPPFFAGCSQAALVRDEPVLVRNYDYAPSRSEGVQLSTRLGAHRVIGTSDCLWGLLDGMNDAGLAVSLTFGGRQVLGAGFGIPLVVRYLLETCATVADCRAALDRLPFQLAHNLTLLDASGAMLTAHVSPDRAPVYTPLALATNHQVVVEWPEHAERTRTLERADHLAALLADPATTPEALLHAFLAPPLYNRAYSHGFGTLYTAAYRPASGVVDVVWPGGRWTQSFASFSEREHVEPLFDAA
jgi:predicted choloylglycine hydrolase